MIRTKELIKTGPGESSTPVNGGKKYLKRRHTSVHHLISSLKKDLMTIAQL